jgi:hypothetical protein
MRDGCERGLTRTTRTALTPLGLRNDAVLDPERLSPCHEPRGAWSADRSSPPGYPREVSSSAHPFARSVMPRQLVKAASVPRELDPPSTRIFRCRATNEPEMRLAGVCNPHVKDEHPLIRVASGFVFEGAPDLTGGRCLHVATARFGRCSAAPSGVVFPLEPAAKLGPLMPLSPLAGYEVRPSHSPFGRDRCCRRPT